MLEHGGRLRAAARRWGIAQADWLDLSTGIAPWSYPLQVPAAAWQRLPEDDDELVDTAARYYGHPAPLPLPGSQAAIQWLPRLLPAARTVLPRLTYAEYAPAWLAAGHEVHEVAYAALPATPAEIVMLANPNNPSGERLNAARLHELAARCRWLVVDEAFADCAPGESLAALAGTALPNLIVLRSLGKFFGLAGARVGFLCAAPELQQRLAAALGPWALSHPARVAATQALADAEWQAQQRTRLAAACARLQTLLAAHGLPAASGGDLFCYAPTEEATALHDFLAARGILVRLFAAPAALRFGLPGAEADWQRLAAALTDWSSR